MKRFEIIGNNIVRSGDVITLDFEEVEYIRQPFGTRVENVTPFLVTFSTIVACSGDRCLD